MGSGRPLQASSVSTCSQIRSLKLRATIYTSPSFGTPEFGQWVSWMDSHWLGHMLQAEVLKNVVYPEYLPGSCVICLKSSTPHFVPFLIYVGSVLNSFGPCTWNEWSLTVYPLCAPIRFGMTHFLPCLSSLECTCDIPQFDTLPSRTFHVYIILHLSYLLCSEFIFKCFREGLKKTF